MLCKRCHAEVPENERFCPTCGSLQPMICPGCSAENRPGSRSCSACGKKLPAAQRPDKPVTPKRKRSPMEIAAIAAVTLGALLLLAAAVLFLTKSVSFDDSTAVREQTQTQPEAPEPVEEVPEETCVSLRFRGSQRRPKKRPPRRRNRLRRRNRSRKKRQNRNPAASGTLPTARSGC